MGKKQYNSAADRRWQQRYQRIQERKDFVRDVETPRSERRRQKRTLYNLKNININRLLNEKVAVVCTTIEQARKVITKAQSVAPNRCAFWIETLQEMFSICDGVIALGIHTTDYWFGESENLKCETVAWFERRGYEIIDFYELMPVVDLGDICHDESSLNLLFEY